jgi:inner membrane protein
MEPATHALVSLALSRAGFSRTTRLATPLLLVSGMAADLDLLSYLGGAGAFLRVHGTLFHSLFGSAVLMCILAGLACFADRRWNAKPNQFPLRFGPALLVCAIGDASHLLLDLCGSFPIRILWPFSNHWYAWDFVPLLDPWILLILAAGLLLPALFLLVSEEIGDRRKSRGAPRGAMITLFLVAAYLGGRGYLHSRALALLLSREYHGAVPLAAGAFPSSASPLEWRGVVSTDNTLETVDVSFASASEFDPDRSLTHYKPEPSPALDAAERSETAQRFVAYAQFPLASLDRLEEGSRFQLRDLRSSADSPGFADVVAIIDLDTQLRVTHQEFRFASTTH